MSKVNVIVCTHNRCESLKDTLRALSVQKTGKYEVEITVVDNCSTDNTRDVVMQESWKSLIPIRYVFEAKPGKSNALNRGISESKADYLLFTDDDALPRQDWVKNSMASFRKNKADCVGGPILPKWHSVEPDWFQHKALRRNFSGVLGLLDYGHSVKKARKKDENFLFGCNIAVKKEVFEKIGHYNPELGPMGVTGGTGEDTDMMRRMLDNKMKVFYDPHIVVDHKVETERMKISYARKRRYVGGKNDFYRYHKEEGRVPFWVFLNSMEMGFKSVCAYLTGQKYDALDYELHFWSRWGRVIGGLKYQLTKQKYKKSGALTENKEES